MELHSTEYRDKVQSNEFVMAVDEETINRIRQKTMKKAGFIEETQDSKQKSHKKVVYRRFVGAAAAMLIIAGGVVFGNKSIANAFHQVVAWIQGYGEVENTGSDYFNPDNTVDISQCDYYFTNSPDELCTDNGEYQILVTNSYVIGNKVTVSWMITGMSESFQADEKPEVSLYANDKLCECTSKKITSRKTVDKHLELNGTYEYTLDKSTIAQDTKYNMVYDELQMDYTLAKCIHTDSTVEIVSQNGFAYNSECILEGNQLTVYLYEQTKSPYKDVSLALSESYKEVYLETDKGRIYADGGKEYVFYGESVDGAEMNKAPYYTFTIPEGMNAAKLVIPYMIARDVSNTRFTIPYLNKGESIAVNKDIDLGLTHVTLNKVTMSNDNILTLNFEPETGSNKEITDLFVSVVNNLEKSGNTVRAEVRDTEAHDDQSAFMSHNKDKCIYDAAIDKDTITDAQQNGYEIMIDYPEVYLTDNSKFDIAWNR